MVWLLTCFLFILLHKQHNKLRNVFRRMKANTIRAKTVFVHQPQQGLQASSVGCSPLSCWVRSLLQPRVMLSLEWDGDQRHIWRSLHNADGELPCKLNVQKHNVRKKKKKKRFRQFRCFSSCRVMTSDLYEQARLDLVSVSGTPPDVENCTLQPRWEQSAERRRHDLHHFWPANGKRCEPHACDLLYIVQTEN